MTNYIIVCIQVCYHFIHGARIAKTQYPRILDAGILEGGAYVIAFATADQRLGCVCYKSGTKY